VRSNNDHRRDVEHVRCTLTVCCDGVVAVVEKARSPTTNVAGQMGRKRGSGSFAVILTDADRYPV